MPRRHNIRELYVFLHGELIGTLDLYNGHLRFTYVEDATASLSVSMSATQRIHDSKHVEAWFLGLLPDPTSTRRFMSRNKTYGANSIFGLLSEYGADCTGAIQVFPSPDIESNISRASYAPIDEEYIGRRLSKMSSAENKGVPVRWHESGEIWSLAGGQPKLALMEKDDKFYQCLGGATSNIIVKPGAPHLPHQAAIEHITMSIAREVGLNVASTRIADFGGTETIVIERHDRARDEYGNIARIHQEDLCQALGVEPEQKYLPGKTPTIEAANLIRQYCDEDSLLVFVDSVLFNYLIGGTDGHLKNHSLLHVDGKVVLAPLYDIASRFPYFCAGDLMHTALGIGHERRIGRVGKKALSDMASMLDMDTQMIFDRFISLAEIMPVATERAFAAAAAEEEGINNVEEIYESYVPRVKKHCGAAIQNLSEPHFIVPDLFAASAASLSPSKAAPEGDSMSNTNPEQAIFRDPSSGQVSSDAPHNVMKDKNKSNKKHSKHHKVTKTRNASIL